VSSALGVLRPGGTLVMASCTARVTAETYYETVREQAAAEGRPLEELERTGHPLDHPVTFPEGAYLKCLFARAP
jgi:23S rRNA (cytosine1962-C5)-methyltransferase